MKKSFLLFCVVILCISCSDNKPDEKTVIGMFTPYEFFSETVNGKVKEIRETNFFPVEKEGKIEAGTRLTDTDHDSLRWTPDFIVKFNEYGQSDIVNHLNENDEITESWIITNGADYPVSAKFLRKDSLVYLNEITKINDNSYQWDIINPETDTLRSRVIMEYDIDNNFKNLNWYNSKGEPLSKYEWSYDTSGHLTGYTYSRKDTLRGGMKFTYNEKGFWETQ